MITYIAETEKAVKLNIWGENYVLDQFLPHKEVWVPKSQLSENGVPGLWITGVKAEDAYGERVARTSEIVWVDAKGREFEPEATEREVAAEERRQAAMKAGLEALNELVEYGKARGVKGLRKGLKKSTVLRMFAQAGVEVPVVA